MIEFFKELIQSDSVLFSNIFGFYVPFLISILIIIAKFNLMLKFLKTNMLLIGYSAAATGYLSSLSTEEGVVYGMIFAVFPLLCFVLFYLKEKNIVQYITGICPYSMYVFTFTGLLLVDVSFLYRYNLTTYSAIGGAGIVDGLLITPLFSAFMFFLIMHIKKTGLYAHKIF